MQRRVTVLASLFAAASIAQVAPSARATVFSNPTSIVTPASGTSGRAALYPSEILVSGVSDTVVKVTVTLDSLSHTCTPDLDVAVVGPGGQNVLLMSDNGRCGDFISGVTLTFDDAAGPLPEAGAAVVTSGTYRPSNSNPIGDSFDGFPPPGPSGTLGSMLSVFNGIDPNGTWQLFVMDDTSADVGRFGGGWSIDVVVPEPGGITLTALIFAAASLRRVRPARR